MLETRLTADGLSPVLITDDIASAIQGLYSSGGAGDSEGRPAPVACDIASAIRGLYPSGGGRNGGDPEGPPAPVTDDIASAIRGLYSSGSADRNGEGTEGPPVPPPGHDDEPIDRLSALPAPDDPPSVPGPGCGIHDGPVDHLAGPGVPASVPDAGLLTYGDGGLWFPGIDGSRVRLARFDGGKLVDVDPGTVSERDVSALRVLFGIILESRPDGAAAKPEGRIGLDPFLELTGHGSVDRDDRIGTAKDAMSRYNGLVGKAADRSICRMIDIVYHGGSDDTVSFTSPYLDILLRMAPPRCR